jgi:hypothetical protein
MSSAWMDAGGVAPCADGAWTDGSGVMSGEVSAWSTGSCRVSAVIGRPCRGAREALEADDDVRGSPIRMLRSVSDRVFLELDGLLAMPVPRAAGVGKGREWVDAFWAFETDDCEWMDAVAGIADLRS